MPTSLTPKTSAVANKKRAPGLPGKWVLDTLDKFECQQILFKPTALKTWAA